MMEIIQTYDGLMEGEIEVWVCDCGREHHIQAGGDIAFCYCEFEGER